MNRFDSAKAEIVEQFPAESKVRYTGDIWWAEGITGRVTGLYPSFDEDLKRTPEWDSVCVSIDNRPEHWPYKQDAFAPDISELELV